MKRVAIWAAVSSLPQAKKVSLDDQLRVGREHAERHGATVVAELVVPGESRDIVLFETACHRIAAYATLRGLIEAKGIDVLIYLDRSRLGRTAALSMAVAELCNRAGILLYETDSPPASMEFQSADYSDMLIGAIKSVDAQQEVRKIQDRHRKGMIGRVEKGKMPGKINFGYVPQYEGGKLAGYAVDERAAATVRMIVSLYLDRGLGAANIADHLNRLGREAPAGGLWAHSQITFLLRRIWRYAGYAELNVFSKTNRPYVRAKGQWPEIISEERARAVLAERAERNKARKSVHTVYRFTRMVYCSVCGARLHALTKHNFWERDDGTTGESHNVYYRCPGDHVTIGEKRIIKFLSAHIRDLDSETHDDDELPEESGDDDSAITTEVETLQKQLAQLRAGMAKADLDYYSGGALDSERHQAIIGTLKARMAAIELEIALLTEDLNDASWEAQRAERLEDIRLNGLTWLEMEDVRQANVHLRQRFRIYVEKRRVVEIEAL